MKIKSFLAKPYATIVHKRVLKEMKTAVADQKKIFDNLVKTGSKTIFGRDHNFKDINDYESFKKHVPLKDYEGLKPYIEQIKQGKDNVLWKGKPIYFAKTSGTTSGVKYIPISKDSISNHINGAKNALLIYMAKSGKADFADGQMIFLSGSPTLERIGGIPTGRLSGIVNHHIPLYLRKNQLPSFETNCIEDWEEKLAKIVEETINKEMTLISGIPPWMQMYFDWLIASSNKKTIKEIFPNLQLLVHGGVNFQPYKKKLMESVGDEIDTIETYPASEGFFAYQDRPGEEGLLLNTNSGIFFEFVPASEIFDETPTRLCLNDVKVGENYALIINSNAGLWGYNIGDTIKFISLDPFRIMVTGRTKHYISAFGEHVIAEEVEEALLKTANKYNIKITEFTVAPKIQVENTLPFHEWFIEFENLPDNLESFAQEVDNALREKNIYYNDLIVGNILQRLQITPLQKGSFKNYMKSIGKLGGQNKTPRLSNDRNLADKLTPYKLQTTL